MVQIIVMEVVFSDNQVLIFEISYKMTCFSIFTQGPGVGYIDTTSGNSGGGCRADDVDLRPYPNDSQHCFVMDIVQGFLYSIFGVKPEC
jgi:hypothetical protein